MKNVMWSYFIPHFETKTLGDTGSNYCLIYSLDLRWTSRPNFFNAWLKRFELFAMAHHGCYNVSCGLPHPQGLVLGTGWFLWRSKTRNRTRHADSGWWFGIFFMFHSVVNVIIPTDFRIFFGVAQPPTSDLFGSSINNPPRLSDVQMGSSHYLSECIWYPKCVQNSCKWRSNSCLNWVLGYPLTLRDGLWL